MAEIDDRHDSDSSPPDEDVSLLRTVPGLARIAAAAYLRSARWTAHASAEAGQRVIKAAMSGQDPGELFRSTGAEIRERTRRVLGVEPRPEERAVMTPEAAEAEREEARKSLRERGEELLRSAMREDEWLLLLHGAVLGFVAGCIHLAIFGV